MSDTRIDYSISMRPTRLRLLTAMGISACAILLSLVLLGKIIEITAGIPTPAASAADPITVRIKDVEDDPAADRLTEAQTVRQTPQAEPEHEDVLRAAEEPVNNSPPEESLPARDWQLIAGKAARDLVNDQWQQEEFRETMWRQSYSAMFQPTKNTIVTEEEPIIADLRFIPRVHVLGLGLTFGSCFFGIPILGGPVEQRTGAITLVICAQES